MYTSPPRPRSGRSSAELARTLALRFAGTLLCIVAFATPASGQDRSKDPARRHFEAGLALYAAHDYAGALREFESSYALGKRASALMNVAQTQRELGRYVQAYDAYARLLHDHGAQLPEDDRYRVKKAIDELALVTGTVTIEGAPGAEVAIDGVGVGRLPLAARQRLLPGPHRVVVTKDGVRFEREVTVADAEDVSIRVEHATPPPPSQAGSATNTITTAARPAEMRAMQAPDADRGGPEPPRRFVMGARVFIPLTVAGAPHTQGAASAGSQAFPIGAGAAVQIDRPFTDTLAFSATAAFAFARNVDMAALPSGGRDEYAHSSYGGFGGAGLRATSRGSSVRFTGAANLGLAVRSIAIERTGASPALAASPGYVAPAAWLDGGVIVRLSPSLDFTGGVIAWLDVPSSRVDVTSTADLTTYAIASGPHVFVGPSAGLTWGR